MAQRAVSSSVTDRWTYDVFLNFRGEDTRSGFTGHLYNSLREMGINAFIDDEALIRGEEITPSVIKAIQLSRIAIVVFSQNYASSTFCLDELAKIIECFKGDDRLVLPIFYDVDPSDVRHQRGSYGDALDQHQQKFKHKKEKVQRWRLALSEAAEVSGWHIRRGIGYEYEFIGRITSEVSTKINRTSLHVTECPVGLESRVQMVTSLLDLWSNEEVRMVGICGIGGIGKSTIARAVYNSILDHFEGLCFLSNVRENFNRYGLSYLQETLLYELTREKDLKLRDVYKGISIIEHRLHQKKILLFLDDVDKVEQLRALAGRCDWFGSGSRIIITTRNKHLLVSHGVKEIYDVKELNNEEALELFCRNAFKNDNMDSSYTSVSNRAILYSSGLPLALEVIGSSLCGKQVDEWSSALDKYKRIPNKEVLEVLKLSYDALEEDEKEIFLDLACFFKGHPLEYVTNMLRSVHGIERPEYAIAMLVDKSLIKIDYDNVTMHDLIQDMGKEIVRQESPKEPNNRSRLWLYEDILHVFQENMGTDKVEAIMLDLPQHKEVRIQWSGKALQKMKNLKVLIIRNACFSRGPEYLPNSLRVLEWKGYPSKFLPYDFHPAKLFYLDLSNSCCVLLKPLHKKFESLNYLKFKNCNFLRQVPDLSAVPNLTELWLNDCPNLIGIHDSVRLLDKLRRLSAKRCTKLRTLPHAIKWTSLECLELFGCSSLQTFPEILDKMEKLRKLSLNGTAIEELPSSICNLTGLQCLNLGECKSLKRLPSSIHLLPKLWILEAKFCSELRYHKKWKDGEQASSDCPVVSLTMASISFLNCNLSDDFVASCLSCFPNMMSLDLSFSNFTSLPACIKEFQVLRHLSLDHCKQLRQIAGMPPNLMTFNAKNCTSLTWLSSSLLLNQAFHQPGNRSFILPGESIPEWFDHYNKGKSVHFWVRKMFPAIVVCILVRVFCDKDCQPQFSLSVRVDGIERKFSSDPVSVLTMDIDHIYLCDLQRIPHHSELPKVDEWNQVEVSVQQQFGIPKKEVVIKYTGVHVYKQENNIENIRFTKPNPPKRTYLDFCISNNDLESDLFPSLKVQKQLPLLNSIPPTGCATLSKHKEQNLTVHNEGDEWLSLCPDYLRRMEINKQIGDDTDTVMLQNLMSLDGATLDYPAKGLTEYYFKSFPVTTSTNIQAPSPIASGDRIAGGELLQTSISTMLPTTIHGSPKNQLERSLNEIKMEAFYASLEDESSVLSPFTNTRLNKETPKALKIVQDLLSKFFLFCCIRDTTAL